jgi:hypothetical protein
MPPCVLGAGRRAFGVQSEPCLPLLPWLVKVRDGWGEERAGVS